MAPAAVADRHEVSGQCHDEIFIDDALSDNVTTDAKRYEKRFGVCSSRMRSGARCGAADG